MEYILNNLIVDTEITNTNLKNAYDLTKQQIVFKTSTAIDDTKKLIEEATNTKKEASKKNENKKKRFKLMEKYGDILKKISNLLDIMPTNFDDLSLEELNKNIYELNYSRKRNFNIMKFDHFQNLFSEITNDLLQIEKDFQNGKISSKDAYSKVVSLKEKMDVTQMPPALESTKNELEFLISTYQQEFKSTADLNVENIATDTPQLLNSFNLKERFVQLNTRTNALSENIANLHNDISEFNPTADINDLYSMLKSTNDEVAKDDWDYDVVSEKLMDLDHTTNHLTTEQQITNNEHEKLAERVNEVNKECVDIKVQCSNEIVVTMHKNANIRSQNSINIVETIQDESLLTSEFMDIATQYTNVINEQANTDNEICLKASESATDLNTTTLTTATEYDAELNAEAIEKSEQLTEQIRLQQENMLILKPETDDEDSTPPAV